jgi:hypothetical protein
MEPKKLAEALKKLGFDVVRLSYADDQVDAGIEISDRVGVQIFTYEPGFCVVREIPKAENPEQSVFSFGAPRTRVVDLATDLTKALEADKQAQEDKR